MSSTTSPSTYKLSSLSKGKPSSQVVGICTYVTSLRRKDSVILNFSPPGLMSMRPPTEWRLPRDLLRQESKHFRAQLQDEATTVLNITLFGVDTIELLLQWLLTGSYYEHTGFVQKPIYCGMPKTFSLSPLPEESADTMVWCVKAAVVAWKLG
jgi:hypothetical protein